MNILYQVLTDNINNKDQCNNVIEYKTKFDDTFSLSTGTPIYNFIVVTVSLKGGKRNKPNMAMVYQI